jgi:hypothetical protein
VNLNLQFGFPLPVYIFRTTLQDGDPYVLPNAGIPICKAKPSQQMENLHNSAVRGSYLKINLIPPDR